jgi:hypothetical protein
MNGQTGCAVEREGGSNIKHNVCSCDLNKQQRENNCELEVSGQVTFKSSACISSDAYEETKTAQLHQGAREQGWPRSQLQASRCYGISQSPPTPSRVENS